MPCEMDDDDVPADRPEDEFEGGEDCLSRDAILQASDLPIERVPVPEWGGSVCVRTMTGHERDELENVVTGGVGNKANLADFRARLATLVLCDRSGERLFRNGDIEALTKKSAIALDRVFQVAKKLNRIGADEMAELVENFSDAPAAGSGSGSPSR